MTAYTAEYWSLVGAIMPVLIGTDWWPRRNEVAWYVSRCEMAGFCVTDEQRRLCAQRYMAGKRRVTPPGFSRRKREQKALAKVLRSVPVELAAAIATALQSPAAAQYRAGNAKALNQVIGLVLRAVKYDPKLVAELVAKELKAWKEPT